MYWLKLLVKTSFGMVASLPSFVLVILATLVVVFHCTFSLIVDFAMFVLESSRDRLVHLARCKLLSPLVNRILCVHQR